MVRQNTKTPAPCGSWPSPITPELAAGATGTLDYPVCDGDMLYWLESHPENKGRNTIMRLRRLPASGSTSTSLSQAPIPADPGSVEEVLPAPLNAHSRVHEYGGRPYTVKDGILYFVEQDDQRIYRLDTTSPKGLPEALSPEGQGLRFAELSLDLTRDRLIAVCEQHSSTQGEPENFIAAISLDGSQSLKKLVAGADFYAYPCLSPDASSLAWISWQHPNMPWDSTTLEVASFDAEGAICELEPSPTRLSMGGDNESIVQLKWSPDGSLFFVSDHSEWWNLYRLSTKTLAAHSSDSSSHIKTTSLCPMAAEFATPLWTLGMSNYAIDDSNSDDKRVNAQTILTAYTQEGRWHLGLLDAPQTGSPGSLQPITTAYSQISALSAQGGRAWFIAASPQHGSELVEIDLATQDMVTLRQIAVPAVDLKHFSQPQALHYPTTQHDTAHGFYYPPTHPEYCPRQDEVPPLIALCHGGPTGATSTALSYKVQFWTNRGFAVADFNYRGSTGFGRQYRDKLKLEWGRADVDDIVAGVEYLCKQGLADPDRLLIRGSSAGGYTVLAALAFTDTFRAGASLYGIGDLETLARDTHKFEARVF